MGKAFSEIEKTLIKEQIINAGIKLFSKFGITKTSIDDITKEVGIGRGTFYLFFASKELFIAEIFEKIETEFIASLLGYIETSEEPQKFIIKNIIRECFFVLEKYPILKLFFENEDEMKSIFRSLPDVSIARLMNNDILYYEEISKSLIKKGISINLDKEFVVAFCQAVSIIPASKNRIGEKTLAVMEMLTEMTYEYLINKNIITFSV